MQVLGKIFRVFDVNGDGIISKEEMNILMKDMYDLIKSQKPECQSLFIFVTPAIDLFPFAPLSSFDFVCRE